MSLGIDRSEEAELDDSSAAGQQVNHQHYDSEHQQQVDEATHRVTRYQSNQPQNQQNHKNRPKHFVYLLEREFARF
jgi:hypothetical protein